MNSGLENEEIKIENPWANGNRLPTPQKQYPILHAILLLVGTLGIPFFAAWIFPLPAWVPTLAWFVLSAGLFFATSRASSGAILAIVGSLFFTMFGGGAATAALGFTASVLCGAYLITVKRTSILSLILPLISFGIAFAVSQNVKLALLAFLPLPAMILLAVATRFGEYRTTAVCYTIGGILVSAAVVILVFLFETLGTLDPGAVKDWILSVQASVLETAKEVRSELISLAENAEVANEIMQTLGDDFLADMIAEISVLVPAVFVIVCSVIAFLAQKMLNASYLTSGMGSVLTPESEFFTMSVPASVIFAVAFVLSCFLDPLGIVGAVASNLSLILLPGMALIGGRAFVIRFRRNRGTRGNGMLIFLAVLGVLSGQILALLGLFGAWDRVFVAVRAKQNH